MLGTGQRFQLEVLSLGPKETCGVLIILICTVLSVCLLCDLLHLPGQIKLAY